MNAATIKELVTNVGPAAREGAWLAGGFDFALFLEPGLSKLEKAGQAHVITSIGKEVGRVEYTSFFAKKSWLAKNGETAQKWTNAIAKAQAWMQTAKLEEIAQSVTPFFPGITIEDHVAVINRYLNSGGPIWASTTEVDKGGIEKLQELMISRRRAAGRQEGPLRRHRDEGLLEQGATARFARPEDEAHAGCSPARRLAQLLHARARDARTFQHLAGGRGRRVRRHRRLVWLRQEHAPVADLRTACRSRGARDARRQAGDGALARASATCSRRIRCSNGAACCRTLSSGRSCSGSTRPRHASAPKTCSRATGSAISCMRCRASFRGGMRQRAALARTLCPEPEILLLDEPFSALDFQTRLALSDEIGEILRSEGKTVILVTHDIGEAVCMASRVIVMSRRPGRIKSEHRIDYPSFGPERPTPFEARKCPEFNGYFQAIWDELDLHSIH